MESGKKEVALLTREERFCSPVPRQNLPAGGCLAFGSAEASHFGNALYLL